MRQRKWMEGKTENTERRQWKKETREEKERRQIKPWNILQQVKHRKK